MTPSYMHQGMSSQHMAAGHQQHMMSQQPRMPRPGMAQYSNQVMVRLYTTFVFFVLFLVLFKDALCDGKRLHTDCYVCL